MRWRRSTPRKKFWPRTTRAPPGLPRSSYRTTSSSLVCPPPMIIHYQRNELIWYHNKKGNVSSSSRWFITWKTDQFRFLSMNAHCPLVSNFWVKNLWVSAHQAWIGRLGSHDEHVRHARRGSVLPVPPTLFFEIHGLRWVVDGGVCREGGWK